MGNFIFLHTLLQAGAFSHVLHLDTCKEHTANHADVHALPKLVCVGSSFGCSLKGM